LTDSTLARFPALSRELGPVAAPSRRLASRYSNVLRGGYPVGDWTDLAEARMIWIQIPAAELAESLLNLRHAMPSWKGKTAVLIDPTLDCAALAVLGAAGAHVASLTHAPFIGADLSLVEGDIAALAMLRPVLRRARLRTVCMKPGSKLLFTAGLMVAGALTGPLLDAVVRSMRAAGVDPSSAKRIAGHIVATTARNFLAHGRNVWINPASDARSELTCRQLESLAQTDGPMHLFVSETLQAALRWYGEKKLPGTLPG
jgi:hypothetical protein